MRATELEFRTTVTNLYPLMYICHYHLSSQYKFLIDLVAHHKLSNENGNHFSSAGESFVIVYLLLNVVTGVRARVSAVIKNTSKQTFTELFSVTSLFRGAN